MICRWNVLTRRTKKKSIPYKEIFEKYLRSIKVHYLEIKDHPREANSSDTKLKAFDFMIFSEKSNYTVELRGRQYAAKVWANWLSKNMINNFKNWKTVMPNFKPIFVWIYYLDPKTEEKLKDPFIALGGISNKNSTIINRKILDFQNVFIHKGMKFVIVAMTLDEYVTNMKKISTDEGSWKAFQVLPSKFCNIVKPLQYFIPEAINKE